MTHKIENIHNFRFKLLQCSIILREHKITYPKMGHWGERLDPKQLLCSRIDGTNSSHMYICVFNHCCTGTDGEGWLQAAGFLATQSV